MCSCHLLFLFSCVPYSDLPHEGETSLLERLARKPNFTIVEDFYKCNDFHKNYRIIRGESQSDSSRHREVVVLHRCGEWRLGARPQTKINTLYTAVTRSSHFILHIIYIRSDTHLF